MNPTNIIHRRRAARNKVKEAQRNLGSGVGEPTSQVPDTGGDPKIVSKPEKKKSFFKKKKKK